MANNSLSHHLLLPLAADCSDDDPATTSFAFTFPSFWPPFPSLLSDSDSDAAPFPPRHMDRRAAAASRQETAAAFLGLDFHDDDDDDDDEDWPRTDLPLCWDCLQLEEHDAHQRWDLGLSDADEWEQVAARGHEEVEPPAAARALEWEVLLAANSLGSLMIDEDVMDDTGVGGIDTYFLDDDDDVLFGQLAAEAEHEPPAKCGRAAAKATVEGLPTVVVAEADAVRGGAQCAVCKDGIEAGEGARRLPCAHLYHDACILPWLAIRNTCPLCRHELPTDDPDYEKWKARQAAAGADANGDRYGVAARQADEATLLND